MPVELTSVAMPRLSIAVSQGGSRAGPREEGITDRPLPTVGIRTASAVAAVIHAASDQALREPEQANETGRDDQQSQVPAMVGVKTTQRLKAPSWNCWPLKALLQLLLAVVVPMVLLVGLTALLASGRLVLSRGRSMAFGTSNTIWMAGIVAFAAAAMVVALQR